MSYLALAWVKVPTEDLDKLELDETCFEPLHRLCPHATITIKDMTLRPVRTLKDAWWYIAGPPCPPESNLGLRLGKKDPRWAVFECCLSHIEELLQRRVLKVFILENVSGMLRGHDGETALAHQMYLGLQHSIGMSPIPFSYPHLACSCPGQGSWHPSFIAVRAPQSRPGLAHSVSLCSGKVAGASIWG